MSCGFGLDPSAFSGIFSPLNHHLPSSFAAAGDQGVATDPSLLESKLCFPADETVIVEGRGSVKICEVHIGDKVATVNDVDGTLLYSTVTTWLHRDEGYVWTEGEAIELVVSTSPSKLRLRLSSDHLVFVDGREAVAAVDVTVGDKLRVLGESCVLAAEVESVEPSLAGWKGLYAPMTEAGTVLVSGILCSCYAPPRPLVKKIHRTCGPIDVHAHCHSIARPVNWIPAAMRPANMSQTAWTEGLYSAIRGLVVWL